MDPYQEQINAFCKRLAAVRTTQGISAEQLSLDLGQDKGYIAAIESGAQVPTLEAVFAICQRLSIAPALLFADETPLAAQILALPEEQCAQVAEALRTLLDQA